SRRDTSRWGCPTTLRWRWRKEARWCAWAPFSWGSVGNDRPDATRGPQEEGRLPAGTPRLRAGGRGHVPGSGRGPDGAARPREPRAEREGGAAGGGDRGVPGARAGVDGRAGERAGDAGGAAPAGGAGCGGAAAGGGGGGGAPAGRGETGAAAGRDGVAGAPGAARTARAGVPCHAGAGAERAERAAADAGDRGGEGRAVARDGGLRRAVAVGRGRAGGGGRAGGPGDGHRVPVAVPRREPDDAGRGGGRGGGE